MRTAIRLHHQNATCTVTISPDKPNVTVARHLRLSNNHKHDRGPRSGTSFRDLEAGVLPIQG